MDLLIHKIFSFARLGRNDKTAICYRTPINQFGGVQSIGLVNQLPYSFFPRPRVFPKSQGSQNQYRLAVYQNRKPHQLSVRYSHCLEPS